MKPIVVNFVWPPIPTRAFDYCAYFEGEEERGGYGWGPTEEAAKADLLDNCEESLNWEAA